VDDAQFCAARADYVGIFGEEGVARDACDAIERLLGVQLPSDLRRLATFYSGGALGGFGHHAISTGGPATNVVGETLRIRAAVGLPPELVVLAEPPESLMVLTTPGTRDEGVTWCSATDVHALRDGRHRESVDRWPSYYAFFRYLLDLEMEERGLRPAR
jgi:hypothetical protein